MATKTKSKRPAAGSRAGKTSRPAAAVRTARRAKPVAAAARKPAKAAKAGKPGKPVTLLVGTRKGAFILKSDGARSAWKVTGPLFLGNLVYHMILDPRDGKTMLAAVKTGHLGPTVFRSTDGGKTWKEAAKPPAFPKAPEGQNGKSVGHVFWLTPGHASEPDVWYAGTSPHGLFVSADGGVTWSEVHGFNNHPMAPKWMGSDVPPDGATTHSIQIDPRDPHHMYVCLSVGGVFETRDGGRDWKPVNAGLFIDYGPNPYPEYGQDPHCMAMAPTDPDRFYQQNHCGIYRMDRAEGKWHRIGDNMPREIRDIGFPVVIHPRDRDTAWVFPMDGTEVWPRTSPGGKPAAYMTRDSGKTWKRQDKGLPKSQGWFTVFRQSMVADGGTPVGLYFGTTSGDVWASTDEGKSWTCICRHLPKIQCVEVAGKTR